MAALELTADNAGLFLYKRHQITIFKPTEAGGLTPNNHITTTNDENFKLLKKKKTITVKINDAIYSTN